MDWLCSKKEAWLGWKLTGERGQRGCVAEGRGVVTMVQGETAASGSTEHGHREDCVNYLTVVVARV